MEFDRYVRKPFAVEAIEVTEENIEELAEFIGTIRYKDGKTFIHVDRRLIPNVYRVWPGFWMTRMGDNIRCYSAKIFNEQFMATNPHMEDVLAWVESYENSVTVGLDPNFVLEPDEVTEATSIPLEITISE